MVLAEDPGLVGDQAHEGGDPRLIDVVIGRELGLGWLSQMGAVCVRVSACPCVCVSVCLCACVCMRDIPPEPSWASIPWSS